MSSSGPDIVAACWTTAGPAVPWPGLEVSPIPLTERIDAAAAAGFTGFGFVHHDLIAHRAAGGNFESLRRHLDSAGIPVSEVEFLNDWWLPEPERTDSDVVLELLVEAAGVLRARDVKIGPDITGGPFDLDRYAANLHRVAEAFAAVNTVVSMEFMPFSNIPTLADGLELVRKADHPNAGLMIDIWHLIRGGTSLEELAQTPIELITGVELDDGAAKAEGDGYEDTIHRRLLCGQGDFPVVEFIRTLVDVGWRGPWGLEIINAEYRQRPLVEAVTEAYQTTRAVLSLAGVEGDAAGSTSSVTH